MLVTSDFLKTKLKLIDYSCHRQLVLFPYMIDLATCRRKLYFKLREVSCNNTVRLYRVGHGNLPHFRRFVKYKKICLKGFVHFHVQDKIVFCSVTLADEIVIFLLKCGRFPRPTLYLLYIVYLSLYTQDFVNIVFLY